MRTSLIEGRLCAGLPLSTSRRRREAATTIQAVFRGYLVRSRLPPDFFPQSLRPFAQKEFGRRLDETVDETEGSPLLSPKPAPLRVYRSHSNVFRPADGSSPRKPDDSAFADSVRNLSVRSPGLFIPLSHANLSPLHLPSLFFSFFVRLSTCFYSPFRLLFFLLFFYS